MAERPRLYERRWARAAAALVGFVALSGCKPLLPVTSPEGGQPAVFEPIGQLDCYPHDGPNELRRALDFSGPAMHSIILYARTAPDVVPDGMRIKFFGPEGSVVATRESGGPVDVDKGTTRYGQPVTINDVLPYVSVTAEIAEPDSEIIDVVAKCV